MSPAGFAAYAAPAPLSLTAGDCGILNNILRGLSLISLLGMMVSAGYLIYLGGCIEYSPNPTLPQALNNSLGVFHVIVRDRGALLLNHRASARCFPAPTSAAAQAAPARGMHSHVRPAAPRL